jgi:hypothetical protein
MTVSFKTGAFTSRTTTGTDVITGVGFQPKIIIFFSTADFAADDAFAADYNFRFGVATDTTAANQGGMASYSQDGASVTNCDRVWNSTGALVREVGHSPTIVGAVSAIGSDGFTVNWTTVDGTAHRIHYICIGGTDITNVKSGILTSPTATGNVSYTGPGFQPDFIMLWGNQTTTAGATGSTFGLGFATSSSNQVVLSAASQNNLIPSGTRRYQRSDNVLCLVELDGSDLGSPNSACFGGSLVSMDTNGFTINWSVAITAGQSKSFGYLAVKGGNWKVGSSTSKTSTGTQAVTGVGFQPNGLILASVCQISSTGVGTGNRISFGGGSSSSDNRCVFSGDTTALSTTVSASIQKAAKCISAITEAATHTSSTVNAEAAISTLDASGFTLNWSTASATLYEFLYVAVGGGAAPQNITKGLTETVTVGQPTPARVKTVAGNNIVKTLSQTVTIGQPTPAKLRGFKRGPPAESVTISDILAYARGIAGHQALLKIIPQSITVDDAVATTIAYTTRHITKSLTQTVRIGDSLRLIGKTRHTGDPGYWQPLKPRITIYAFTDSTYSSPIYQYDPFTDSGNIDKPVSLQFESQATSAGTFSLEIENSADTYDPDTFARGNRVVIECSKDGIAWSHAFHGLVRGVKQNVFAVNNRTISIQGYSYLIRLNERILSARKVATILGQVYDRNDTAMHTDNLINDLLTNDTNYAHSVDDTQLYSIFKTNNLVASPIEDWIARIDAPLVTANDAINSILEFSQSLLTIDFTNDQLALFNPDRVPTGGANAFLVTDVLNLEGDSSLNTLYPTSEYTYQISYDFADSANRTIAAIGNAECPEQIVPGQSVPGQVGSVVYSNQLSGPPGSVGPELYRAWQVDNFVGVPISATRCAISVQDPSLYGKVLARISVAIRVGTGISGNIQVGIRKNSDDSFVSFGTFNVSAVPNDSLYHGYDFTSLGNTYALVQFDHVSIEDAGLSASISVGAAASGATTVPLHNFIGGSWSAPGGYVLTAVLNQNVTDTTNWGTIQLNGSSVQRIGILVGAGSGLVGAQVGRITQSVRSNGTHPVGSWQIGIRRGSDNSFISYGAGTYTSITPEDTFFRNYSFDALNNTYKLIVGDRIVIEAISLSSGYLEFECSKNGGTPQQVQIYNGTSWVTTGITNFKLGWTISSTTAQQQPDTVIAPCGGLPESDDADDVLHIATDRNNAKRLGIVEQVISNLPPHVKTFQTLNEYMFNKLYVMAKPRFTFDYPSLTLPEIMPKAGDILCHVSVKAGVGVRRNPIQTGIITQVTYDFSQSSDSILGLRRLSLTSTGVLRGSY